MQVSPIPRVIRPPERLRSSEKSDYMSIDTHLKTTWLPEIKRKRAHLNVGDVYCNDIHKQRRPSQHVLDKRHTLLHVTNLPQWSHVQPHMSIKLIHEAIYPFLCQNTTPGLDPSCLRVGADRLLAPCKPPT